MEKDLQEAGAEMDSTPDQPVLSVPPLSVEEINAREAATFLIKSTEMFAKNKLAMYRTEILKAEDSLKCFTESYWIAQTMEK